MRISDWSSDVCSSDLRAAGPIFVGESAVQQAVFRNRVPEQQRSRLLSVRAYDADGWMLDAEVDEGVRLEALIERFFGDARTAFLRCTTRAAAATPAASTVADRRRCRRRCRRRG